jgi:hypothetical protein
MVKDTREEKRMMTNLLAQLEEEVRNDFKNGGPLVWESAKEHPKQADLVYVEGKIFNYKTDKHGDIPIESMRVVTAEERKHRVSEVLANEPGADLNRLSDVLLYDKLYNPSKTKMRDEEYPILSEYQFDRRDSAESSVGDDIENSPADGRKHTRPTRRQRTDYENKLVDKKSKIRNKERKQRYNEFTKVQPVIIRKTEL